VSKAFTCLADPDKRAFYDRTGHEDRESMASASRANGAGAGGVHMHEVDPQELFNMMFGGAGGFGPGFGMGPFGGFRTMRTGFPPGHRPGQPRGPQQGVPLAGSLPPALQHLWRVVAGASALQKLMMFSMVMRMLPLLIGLVGWALWLLVFALPLHFVCAEVAAFRTRRLYQPLRRCPPVCDAVHAAHPYATAYLRYSAPVVDAAKQAGTQALRAWS
jgi:hypothetical protein